MSGLFFLTVALSIPMTESSRINQPAINSNRSKKLVPPIQASFKTKGNP